jgi:multidrug efflux pump
LETVRTAMSTVNANRPKGQLSDPNTTWQIHATDQIKVAEQYRPIVVSYVNGAPVRLSDVAQVDDSVEDIRNTGLANGKPAVLVIVFRQPGANIIETVDSVRASLPFLKASINPAIDLQVVMDRTTTVRASVSDVQRTLMISIVLVVLVVFAFLRTVRATVIPGIAVPLSLVGTFGVMYLVGYSLDNLSLMALTISTGFVVDDAIVVIENITRHLEAGMKPMAAALLGSKEIGFTVLSMSTSLVAVFIPILLMGGIVGRLFREFAVTLSAAIGVSLVVSLTTTPMMCAKLLRHEPDQKHNWLYRAMEWLFDAALAFYRRTLGWVLRHQPLMLLVTIGTLCLSIYLYVIVPKGFFPQQDTGRVMGGCKRSRTLHFRRCGRNLHSSCRSSKAIRRSIPLWRSEAAGTAHAVLSL